MQQYQELTMNQISGQNIQNRNGTNDAPQLKSNEELKNQKFQDEVMISQNQTQQKMQRAMLDKFEEPRFCLINQENKRRVPLVHKSTIVGRNPNLLISINDISVSSKHASIEMNDEFTKVYLQDKGAQNGTWINDQKMEANAKKRLQHNNYLRFGNSKIVYKFISVEQEKLEKEASDSDGDTNIDQRQRFDMKNTNNSQKQIQNSKIPIYSNPNAVQQWPQPISKIQQSLDVEHRLQQQENQIQMLLGNVARGSNHEKEISIKQIVEDERKLLDDRYRKDLEQMKNQNEQERKKIEDSGLNIRNRNEKLQRVLVEKENDLLRHQSVVSDIETQFQNKSQQYDVSQAKLKALERYTSELQTKHDNLIRTEQEKTQALNELLSNDLTQKLLEYKGMVTELREILKTKEKEREIYVNHLNLGQADPQYGSRLLEDQSKQIIGYQTANEELEYRQGQCEKKWANLLDENQKNNQAVVQLKAQLDQQRQTYTKLLNMTEKRVIQANMQISKLYSDLQEDAKKEAAEYLSAQVYQLYDERRQITSDNDVLNAQNSELQRLCSSQRIELDKYQAYIREDGCGPTASLIAKVEELQDLLIQQRQISDVSKIVQKDAAIRSLNSELARKTEQLEDMKSRIQQLMAAKGGPQYHQNANSNKEIAEYLQGMLKAKEVEVENKDKHIQEVLHRENALKQKLEKMEYLYELDPNKPLIKYNKEKDVAGNLFGQQERDAIRSPHDNLAYLLQNQEESYSGRRQQTDYNNQPSVRNQTGLYF